MQKADLKHILVLFCLFSWATHAAHAQEKANSALQDVYNEYQLLLQKKAYDQRFYDLSSQLEGIYRSNNDLNAAWRVRMDEAIYDSNHGKPYLAIQKANKMFADIKKEKADNYSMVYSLLGTIFMSNGNDRMARHYYDEALKNVNPDDETAKMHIYSQLASLYMLKDPVEAKRWSNKAKPMADKDSHFRPVWLRTEGIIDLASNDKRNFSNTYDAYRQFCNDNPEAEHYGESVLNAIGNAFNGKYQTALDSLAYGNTGLNILDIHEMRIKIYLMMNNKQGALQESNRYVASIDSLNANILFDNLNEINTQMNMAKMKAKAAEDRTRLFIILTVLSILTIIGLVLWFLLRSRMRQSLVEKNEQLETALKMAEESDNMKTEFVRNVSHEVRTPLNAINGFTEIVLNPDIQLGAEDRADLIAKIRENTAAITKIIDELLNLSEKEGGNQYPRTGDIYCNQFLSQTIYSYHDSVSANVELQYTTEVINRFSIKTNPEGLRKVLDHLIQNAIKFTPKGFINLHCRQSDDQSMVEIVLTDTGKGISDEMRAHIFEQFVKEDNFKQGMGLGLAVSRKIAQKMDGNLVLDESYNEGTRFILTLPTE